jgi:glucose-1-phosphate thymidylyltransferase
VERKKVNNDLVGLIPAAGKGTRIAPLPFSKELFPIGFWENTYRSDNKLLPKAVSSYLIDQMINAAVQNVIMVVSSRKLDLLEYYGSGRNFGIHLSYVFDDNLRGMPHSMDLAWHWLQNRTVLFGMPDTIFRPSDVFSQLLSRHREVNADVTLGVFETDHPQNLCVVEMEEDGKVIFLEDKPKKTSLTKFWGCACWSPRFSAFMHQYLLTHSEPDNDGEVVLADVFLAALDDGMDVYGVYFDEGEFIDMGTPESLRTTIGRFSAQSD